MDKQANRWKATRDEIMEAFRKHVPTIKIVPVVSLDPKENPWLVEMRRMLDSAK